MKSKSDITKLLMLLIAAICTILTAEARHFHLAQNGKLLPFINFSDAMEKANSNDTIYLDKGDLGKLNITKPAILIGSPSTIVSIEINLNEQYRNSSIIDLEGVYCYQLSIVSELQQLILKNTEIRNYDHSFISYDNAKINNLIADRCRFGHLYFRSYPDNPSKPYNSIYVDTVSCRNCIIDELEGTAINKNATLLKNCSFTRIQDSFSGSLINCVTIRDDWGTGERIKSYDHFDFYDYDYGNIDISNIALLEGRGCYGNDGTVAGPYGGEAPTYSLIPDYPTVKEGKIEFDSVNKKLKIKVKAYEE